MQHDLTPVVLYAAGIILIWLGIVSYSTAESTRMPVFDAQTPRARGMDTRPSWSVMAVICAGVLFSVFVYLLFRSPTLAAILPTRGITMDVGLSGLAVSLPGPPAAHAPPVLGFALFALFAALALLLQQTLAYAFLMCHAGLALICALVDLIFEVSISDPEKILQHALTATFLLLLVSQVFFASLLHASATGLLSFAISSTISSGAFFAGAAILSVIATQTTETSLMLAIYLVIAYGVVVPHVFALSLSIAAGASRPSPASSGGEP